MQGTRERGAGNSKQMWGQATSSLSGSIHNVQVPSTRRSVLAQLVPELSSSSLALSSSPPRYTQTPTPASVWLPPLQRAGGHPSFIAWWGPLCWDLGGDPPNSSHLLWDRNGVSRNELGLARHKEQRGSWRPLDSATPYLHFHISQLQRGEIPYPGSQDIPTPSSGISARTGISITCRGHQPGKELERGQHRQKES